MRSFSLMGKLEVRESKSSVQVSRLIRGSVENDQSVTGKSSCGWSMVGGTGESSGSAVVFSDMSRHEGSWGSGSSEKFSTSVRSVRLSEPCPVPLFPRL